MTLQPIKIVRLAVVALAPIILTACATTTADNDAGQMPQKTAVEFTRDSSWALRLPEAERALYKGVVSFDGAGGGSGSMLYPAPNVVGFVAAVITHGIINEAEKNNQKTKLEEAADKVLLPYKPVLASYSHKELMQRALEKLPTGNGKKLVGFSEKSGTDWSIESTPVFFITQDQSAVILENSISIYAPGDKSVAQYQNTIRVVSQPMSAPDLVSFWTGEDGKKLREESAGLFAESIDIALGEASNTTKQNNNTYKTFRYLEGGAEKMERGQLISEHCDRHVIKTLRGGTMSIPARRNATAPAGADQCAQVSRNSK